MRRLLIIVLLLLSGHLPSAYVGESTPSQPAPDASLCPTKANVPTWDDLGMGFLLQASRVEEACPSVVGSLRTFPSASAHAHCAATRGLRSVASWQQGKAALRTCRGYLRLLACLRL